MPAFQPGSIALPTIVPLKQLEQRKRDRAIQVELQTEELVASSTQEQRVDAEIESRARQALVHEQLANLPAKYRIVLVLRHLQDMTYRGNG